MRSRRSVVRGLGLKSCSRHSPARFLGLESLEGSEIVAGPHHSAPRRRWTCVWNRGSLRGFGVFGVVRHAGNRGRDRLRGLSAARTSRSRGRRRVFGERKIVAGVDYASFLWQKPREIAAGVESLRFFGREMD